MIQQLLQTNFLKIAVFAQLVVFLAMSIDLGSGLRKASLRGEIHTSWGLKMTIDKLIRYNGSLLITTCMDLFVFFSNLFITFGLDSLQGTPLCTCLWGFFLCFIEYKSVRETNDVKSRKKEAIAKKDLENLVKKAVELKKQINEI